MPKVKIKANKMTEADVSFISLVGRGANRIPFKIVKKEKDMGTRSHFAGLDLSNLGAVFTQKSEVKPEVVAVVTMAGDSLESVSKHASEAGFAVTESATMEDQSVVFKQGEMNDGEGVVIRLNEHVAVIAKGFNPYDMDIGTDDGLSFQEKCNAQGFYPGINTVMDVMRTTIMKMAKEGDDPTAVSAEVTSLFDEAKQYVSGMVRSLPSSVFKMEDIVVEKGANPFAKKPKVDGVVGDGDGADAENPNETAEEKAARLAKVKKDEGAEGGLASAVVEKGANPFPKKPKVDGAGVDGDGADAENPNETAEEKAARLAKAAAKKDEKEAPVALTTEQVSAIVSTQVLAGQESLVKKLGEMLEAVTASVQKSVGDVQATVTALQGQVVQAETVAKAAADAVKGIVVGGEPAGDHTPAVKKSESGSGSMGGEIDTAFTGRPKRNR